MECDYDYCEERPTIHHVTRRKAAKDHKCTECGGIIKKREKYDNAAMLYDGRWETFKTCADCQFTISEVGRTLFAECNGWCYGYTSMLYSLVQLLGEGTTEEDEQTVRICHMHNAAMSVRGGHRIESYHLEPEEVE